MIYQVTSNIHTYGYVVVNSINLRFPHIHPTVYFYIHGYVHRDSILIRSNEIQQYAGVYLLQNYSTCFGCLSHHHQEYIKL